jgi:hypothetical protein
VEQQWKQQHAGRQAQYIEYPMPENSRMGGAREQTQWAHLQVEDTFE